MKKVIEKILEFWGYSLVPKSSNYIILSKNEFNKNFGSSSSINDLVRYLLNRLNEEKTSKIMIFDVGAHYGESIENYRELFPDCTIHAFEPDIENFKELKKIQNKSGINVILNNFACGSKQDNVKFFSYKKTTLSSFNKINFNSAWARGSMQKENIDDPQGFIRDEYDVEVRKLDDYIAEAKIDHIHMLKLDVQGYEDKCLEGCLNTLKKGMVDIIVTEFSPGNRYEKNLQFYDIEKNIVPFGYSLFAVNFMNSAHSSNLLDIPGLKGDLIYINNRLSAF